MEQEFKEGDCVQLKHGDTLQRNISAIHEVTKEAHCVWHDPKNFSKVFMQDIPLSVLKHCSAPVSQQQINEIKKRIIPERK